MNPRIFIFAGEISGDLHGAGLITALKQKNPTLDILGVGGPEMRKAGMECLIPMESFQVMGFIDVFKALPRLMNLFYKVRRLILEHSPELVIFIDYPGFNLRMASHLRKKGYTGKLCHYISPSVWAWKKKRIGQMAATLDLLLVIFPFEEPLFAQTKLPTLYVGHPLIYRIAHHSYTPFPVPEGKTLVSLFPGSRHKEIQKNFPLMLKVAKRLLNVHPQLFFAVSVSQDIFTPLLKQMLEEENMSHAAVLVNGEQRYEQMRASHLAIAKSGTVTLELALHEVPTLVIFQISPLDAFIGEKILRIHLSHYCIVNIICQERVFPEYIGPHLSEETLSQEANAFLDSPQKRSLCQEKCRKLKELLGPQDASEQAAAAVLKLL